MNLLVFGQTLDASSWPIPTSPLFKLQLCSTALAFASSARSRWQHKNSSWATLEAASIMKATEMPCFVVEEGRWHLLLDSLLLD
jgi:hypothetical protein